MAARFLAFRPWPFLCKSHRVRRPKRQNLNPATPKKLCDPKLDTPVVPFFPFHFGGVLVKAEH